jgi:hypothetical protein
MIRYSIDGNGPRPYTSTEIRQIFRERGISLDNCSNEVPNGEKDITGKVGWGVAIAIAALGMGVACVRYGPAIYETFTHAFTR